MPVVLSLLAVAFIADALLIIRADRIGAACRAMVDDVIAELDDTARPWADDHRLLVRKRVVVRRAPTSPPPVPALVRVLHERGVTEVRVNGSVHPAVLFSVDDDR